jgi:hypothetical protein
VDNVGFAPSPTVVLDVDLRNDGLFTDPGDANYATGTLVNDAYVFSGYPALAPGQTYRMQARALDAAGNQGTSAPISVEILSAPVDLTPQLRSPYGGLAGWTTMSDGQAFAGDATQSQVLGLDDSPGPVRGADPMLVYNSVSLPESLSSFLAESGG